MTSAGDSDRSPRTLIYWISAASVVILVCFVAGVQRPWHSSSSGASWSGLLITLDTTRADRFGFAGYRHVETPTIAMRSPGTDPDSGSYSMSEKEHTGPSTEPPTQMAGSCSIHLSELIAKVRKYQSEVRVQPSVMVQTGSGGSWPVVR